MRYYKMTNKASGFTLTEVIATIVILSILVGIAIPVYFNISKSAKENEYTSKKTYLETMAQRYAEENNISSSTKISVSRLIASGYTPAESYMGDPDMPFISNPTDSEDNLACRVVTLTVDNYEINASISDEGDCAFAESDVADSKLGIKAYEFTNNKIGNQLTFEEGHTYNWTNKDVLIVVNPEYEDYKSLIITSSGHSSLVDTNYMLKNPTKDQVININDFTNVVLVNASVITSQSVNVALETESSIASSTVDVRIDKEAPTVDTQKFSGWTSTEKGATVFISDGSGSGAKGVYVSESPNFNDRDKTLKVSKDRNNSDSISISDVNGKKIDNKRYYLWAEDKAGNISLVASYIDISNIDDDKPEVSSVTITSNKSGYNSISTTIKIVGSDKGSGITYACVKTTPGYSDCKWEVFGNGSYTNTNYNVPGATEGNGTTYTLYAYVKDAVGNVSETTYKTASYKIYTRCESKTTTAWSTCTKTCGGGTQTRNSVDKYLGTTCAGTTETQACNTQDCCSKTTATAWTTCSKACATGTQTRQIKSAYDGRVCKTETQNCNANVDCCSKINYSSWTSCNVKCGKGTQTRTKTSAYTGQSCGSESQTCDTKIDCCGKVNYGAWSACPKCGTSATKTRTKTSAYNGQSCGSETASCGLPDCCSSVSYGAWSACPSCGSGNKTRTKTSNYNGQSCGTETASCGSLPACCSKVNYGAWSSCSAPCGGGTQTRAMTSAYNGQSCGNQSQACGGKKATTTNTCSVTTCGTGQYRRDWTSTYNNQSCGSTWDGGYCEGSKMDKEWKFSSDGSVTVPCTAKYYIELYGAQGGGDGGKDGGQGANLDVLVKINAGTTVSFEIGGKGGTSNASKAGNVSGGANGGGTAYWSGGGGGRTSVKVGGTLVAAAGGGGGATFGIAGHGGRCSGSEHLSGSWKGTSTSSYSKECQKDAGAGGGGYSSGGAGGTHESCSGKTGGYGGVSGYNSSASKQYCGGGERAGKGYAAIQLWEW